MSVRRYLTAKWVGIRPRGGRGKAYFAHEENAKLLTLVRFKDVDVDTFILIIFILSSNRGIYPLLSKEISRRAGCDGRSLSVSVSCGGGAFSGTYIDTRRRILNQKRPTLVYCYVKLRTMTAITMNLYALPASSGCRRVGGARKATVARAVSGSKLKTTESERVRIL